MALIGNRKFDATPSIDSEISPGYKEFSRIPCDLDYVLLSGPKYRKSCVVATERGLKRWLARVTPLAYHTANGTSELLEAN
jgi:hypothetical protein